MKKLPPHGRHDDDVSKRLVPAHCQKSLETLNGGACEPHVRYSMHVDDSAEAFPSFVPVDRRSESTASTFRMRATHRSAKDCAMESKVSMSLLKVSWNPGVSINTTGRPSTVNRSEAWTSSVQDLRLVSTSSSELLARLIN